MRINLGGSQMRVPQQLLNTAQIRAGVEQMCGVAVPEFVGRQVGIKAGDNQVCLQTA